MEAFLVLYMVKAYRFKVLRFLRLHKMEELKNVHYREMMESVFWRQQCNLGKVSSINTMLCVLFLKAFCFIDFLNYVNIIEILEICQDS